MLVCALGFLSLVGFSYVQMQSLLVSINPRVVSVNSLGDDSWLKFVVSVIVLDEKSNSVVSPWRWLQHYRPLAQPLGPAQ